MATCPQSYQALCYSGWSTSITASGACSSSSDYSKSLIPDHLRWRRLMKAKGAFLGWIKVEYKGWKGSSTAVLMSALQLHPHCSAGCLPVRGKGPSAPGPRDSGCKHSEHKCTHSMFTLWPCQPCFILSQENYVFMWVSGRLSWLRAGLVHGKTRVHFKGGTMSWIQRGSLYCTAHPVATLGPGSPCVIFQPR